MNYLRRLVTHFCDIEQQRARSHHHRHITNHPAHTPNKQQFQIERSPIANNSRSRSDWQKYCRDLPPQMRGLKASFISCWNGKKVLLLDLDKTLMYYDRNHGPIMRPHLRRFLTDADKNYNIYIFTAATASYVEQALHWMQQYKLGTEYINGYLTREHCIKIRCKDAKTVYIKDLSILHNCPQSQIVIIDDTPISFCLNPGNALHVTPFQGQLRDECLLEVLGKLEKIKECDDVREWIRGDGRGSCGVRSGVQLWESGDWEGANRSNSK